MGRCPDCGEDIHKDLHHASCPYPREKRYMVDCLRARVRVLSRITAAVPRRSEIEAELHAMNQEEEAAGIWRDEMVESLVKERDEARENYQTMLDENVANIERARKAEKERDALMLIAEAAKTCMKACVIAPKRDSRCPNCECRIVCGALKATDIQITAADGEAVERLGE